MLLSVKKQNLDIDSRSGLEPGTTWFKASTITTRPEAESRYKDLFLNGFIVL